MKSKLIKVLIIFFITMGFFTILSRILNSVTIAKVDIVKVESKNLDYDYRFSANVVGKENSVIILPKNIIIENIYVEENNLISVNSPLVSVNKASLDETIIDLTQEFDKLKFQYDTELLNYQSQVKKSNSEIEFANLQLEQLQKSREKEIEKRKLIKENSEETSEVETTNEETISQLDENIKIEEKSISSAKQDLLALSMSSVEMVLIDMNKISLEIQKYNDLKDADYTIYSNFAGSVSKINVQMGYETTTESTIIVSDKSKGIKISGVIPLEDKKNYVIGQKITAKKIKDGKKFDSMLEITKIYESTENEVVNCNVEASLPENVEYPNDLNLNDEVEIDATKSSINYKYCIPISSIKIDSIGNSYIQYITEKDSILGKQFIVEKLEVVILEKNNRYVALKENNLLDNMMIISSSNKEVYENDKVFIEKGISDE